MNILIYSITKNLLDYKEHPTTQGAEEAIAAQKRLQEEEKKATEAKKQEHQHQHKKEKKDSKPVESSNSSCANVSLNNALIFN